MFLDPYGSTDYLCVTPPAAAMEIAIADAFFRQRHRQEAGKAWLLAEKKYQFAGYVSSRCRNTSPNGSVTLM